MGLDDYLKKLPPARRELKVVNFGDCIPGDYLLTGNFDYAFIVSYDNKLKSKIMECYKVRPGVGEKRFNSGDKTLDLPDGEYFLTTKFYIDCLYEVAQEKVNLIKGIINKIKSKK